MRLWKTSTLCLVALNFLWSVGASVASADDKVFIGEIGDTQCAMKVHSNDKSHTEMLKVAGVGKTATDCTLYCIKNRGGRFVLETKRDVYHLDKQELAEPYAGQKVKITGTLDPQTQTIQVRRIDPIAAKVE
jgi:Protein of unknown function (DUF5818)